MSISGQITCPGIDAPRLNEPLTLWVGRYWRGSRSPTGRGSKAYVAFDEKNERLVFLKDYWCAKHPTIHPEAQTYERFRTAKMPPRYVAHCLGGGTVYIDGREQVTLTQRLLEMIWLSSPTPLERAHCRVVLREIGRPLETFEDSSQLVVVLYKAFLGTSNHISGCITFLTRFLVQRTSKRGEEPEFCTVTSARTTSSLT